MSVRPASYAHAQGPERQLSRIHKKGSRSPVCLEIPWENSGPRAGHLWSFVPQSAFPSSPGLSSCLAPDSFTTIYKATQHFDQGAAQFSPQHLERTLWMLRPDSFTCVVYRFCTSIAPAPVGFTSNYFYLQLSLEKYSWAREPNCLNVQRARSSQGILEPMASGWSRKAQLPGLEAEGTLRM